jgi:hypothetical protein
VPHCSAYPKTDGQPSVRPYSPDLVIADFYLFGRLKQQLSRKTLESEENVLETITEILGKLRKYEVKVRACIGKKDASGHRP